ncbi:MAG: tetratricopeptide repeat protein, partial [Candidatus Kapaibacterium sp.]
MACISLLAVLGFASCATMRVPPSPASSPQRGEAREADLSRYCTDLYIKSVSAFTLERYDHGLGLLHRLNSLSPSCEAYLLAAKCHQSMARTDSALTSIRAALAMDDSCVECWNILGDLLLSSGAWCDAATALRSSQRLKDSPGIRYRYATALSECDPMSAVAELESLYDETHTYSLLFELSSLYERLGDSTSEYRTVERIIADMPADGFPMESYVDVLLKGRQYATVFDIIQSTGVRRKSDRIIPLLRQIGSAMHGSPQSIDTSLVHRLYQTVCRVAPEDVDLLELCGLLYHGKGLHSRSVEAFLRALDTDTSYGSMYRIMSFWYEQGDTSGVRRAITRNEDKSRSSFQASLLCAMMYEWCDSTEKAIAWYKHAATFPDSTDEARMYLAGLYGRRGKSVLADRTYEKIIARNPLNHLALNNLAYSYAVKGHRLRTALDYARRALELSPDRPSYLDTYAWALHKSGRYKDADAMLQRAITGAENNATYFEHMGDNYRK